MSCGQNRVRMREAQAGNPQRNFHQRRFIRDTAAVKYMLWRNNCRGYYQPLSWVFLVAAMGAVMYDCILGTRAIVRYSQFFFTATVFFKRGFCFSVKEFFWGTFSSPRG